VYLKYIFSPQKNLHYMYYARPQRFGYCLLLLTIALACKTTHTNTTAYQIDYPLDRFESTIKTYEKQDNLTGTGLEHVIFYGSSSWLHWQQMAQDLAPYKVLNRGFGGSTIPELSYYYDRIVKKHQPKALFIYAGENDLSSTNTKTAEQMLASYVKFVKQIRADFPQTKIYYVSMKLSPSRRIYWPEMRKGNQLVQQYAQQKNMAFVDINPLLVDAHGRIRPELYTADSLHINQLGYNLYAAHFKQILAKINE
jgi:lysophospholipase L1-like esterase